MHHEADLRPRILTRAQEMFAQFGYAKVTMEEIAEGLGISKKTLYKQFSNKGQIVREIIDSTKCATRDTIAAILEDKSVEFVERLKNLLEFIGAQGEKLHGPMIHDLMRNNPELWQEIKEFRRENPLRDISRLIQEGMEQGIFRSDLNKEVVTHAYVGAIHTMIAPDMFEHLRIPPNEIFKELIKIFFEGIFSPEGREKYHSRTIDTLSAKEQQ
jgi:AcrR family transcriptional regulator